jgi:hypothetical protein
MYIWTFNFINGFIMKKIYAITLIIMSILYFVSCKPKDGDNTKLNPGNQAWYDFMSSKSGSYWLFASTDGTFWTRYAREKDTVRSGKTYRYYERHDSGSISSEPEYFGKNNGYYLNMIDIDGKRTNYIDFIYWKDSTGAGTSFTNTGTADLETIGAVDIQIDCQVIEDNLTFTIAGNTIKNIIHTHCDVFGTKALLFPKSKIANIDLWFKKGEGILKQEAHLNVFGLYSRDYLDSVIEYKIVP